MNLRQQTPNPERHLLISRHNYEFFDGFAHLQHRNAQSVVRLSSLRATTTEAAAPAGRPGTRARQRRAELRRSRRIRCVAGVEHDISIRGATTLLACATSQRRIAMTPSLFGPILSRVSSMARLMLPHGRTTDARQGCGGWFGGYFFPGWGGPGLFRQK